MIQYNEVNISRILNPTSIDLGEYVINPYKGCAFACLYCYVRSNKVTSKEKRAWGTYVDVRLNAPERLEKEILLRKPKCVLLGSTTDCFQPIEEKYGLTKKILEILNTRKVFYSILTRSPLITEYVSLLNKGFCRRIYFTINNLPLALKAVLEPKSPSYETRFKAIGHLLENDIPVIPYFSPFLPWISDGKEMFAKFSQARSIEFEGLNFNLANIDQVMEAIYSVYPELKSKYETLRADKHFYENTWENIRKELGKSAISAKKSYNIHIHHFGDYFKNEYAKTPKIEDRG